MSHETPPALVTVDVGGTLGNAEQPGIAAALMAASPLDPRDAARTVRQRLHTAPAITEELISEVCDALQISTGAFPRDTAAAPLRLFAGAPRALALMSASLPVVTLSNVACVDADQDQLRSLLSPWVVGHFPSCRIGYAKPDRRAFRAVASRWGMHTHQIVHIGDHWECDVLGATRAGARAIWISSGRPLPEAQRRVGPNVLVASDLGSAAKHVRDLCTRRQQ